VAHVHGHVDGRRLLVVHVHPDADAFVHGKPHVREASGRLVTEDRHLLVGFEQRHFLAHAAERLQACSLGRRIRRGREGRASLKMGPPKNADRQQDNDCGDSVHRLDLSYLTAHLGLAVKVLVELPLCYYNRLRCFRRLFSAT
jgi:hypothetical protein